MSVLGVVPAAGKGSRWGGFYKELLPVGKGEWLLDRCITTMGTADEILVVTSKDKIGAHVSHLGNKFPNVSFTLQKERNDIMGAIQASFPFTKKRNLFAMPDTYYSQKAFSNYFIADFYLGLHPTITPERFGVLYKDETDRLVVVNKQEGKEGIQYSAWGAMVWSDRVANLWEKLDIADYTEAINTAIDHFGVKFFSMYYYFDMATWNDYFELLKRLNNGAK